MNKILIPNSCKSKSFGFGKTDNFRSDKRAAAALALSISEQAFSKKTLKTPKCHGTTIEHNHNHHGTEMYTTYSYPC
jgi:hypothetical protein